MFSNLWRTFWISVLAIFALETPVFAGCGGWDVLGDRTPHYLRPDLSGRFIPSVTDNASLWPSTDSDESNIDDWRRQAPGATKEDVEALLFSDEDDVAAVLEALKKTEVYDGPLKGNAFVKQAFSSRDGALLSYAMFARRTEALTFRQDAWEYTAPNAENNLKMIAEAKQQHQKASGEFLRLRYGFQTVRLLFLNRDYEEAVKFFEQNLADVKTRSEVLEWSRSFYAGALYWSKRRNDSFVQFAQVFANSPRYRQSAFVSAGWALGLSFGDREIDFGDNVEKILNAAKTEQARMATLTLLAFFRTRFANLDKDPNAASAIIGLLKMRAEGQAVPDDVKMIAQLLIERLEGGLTETFNRILPDLELAILALRDSKGEADPLFWGTLGAYLAILGNDSETARIRIAWVRERDPSPVFADQMKILDLMLAVRNADGRSRDDSVLSGLIWLGKESGVFRPAEEGEKEVTPGYSVARAGDVSEDASWETQWLWYVQRQMLLDLADDANPARSVLFVGAAAILYNDRSQWGSGDNYTYNQPFLALTSLSAADLDRLEDIIVHPGSDLERFLLAIVSSVTPRTINEARGVRQIREGDFAGAVASMSGSADDSQSALVPEYVQDSYDALYALAFSEPGRAFGSYSNYYGVGKLGRTTPPSHGILAQTIALSEQDVAEAMAKGALPDGRSAQDIQNMVSLVNAPTGTRLMFAKQMEALETLRNLPGEAGAKAWYIYAKGLFNRTYFGESWSLSAWSWSSSEEGAYAEGRGEKSDEDYYWATGAHKAFLAAVEKSRDPEFQARALFMASLARQSRDRPDFDKDENGKRTLAGPYFANNPDFTRLKKEFSNTRFYEAANNTCSFLKDFSLQ